MLEASAGPLVEHHDLVMFDLDGVVHIGSTAVPGAPGHLERVREAGAHVAFVTNNASRTPAAVVARLARLGVTAVEDDVVTSAQAAAHLLLERFGEGAVVATLGAEGLTWALEEVGLVAAAVSEERAVALVTGYGPDVPWRDVMQAAVRAREGLPWVASNGDLTLPTKTGPAPGHGVLVDMVSRFAGVRPEIAGKPQRPLLEETIRRVGGERPLMVGDRLDTDIEGARNTGVDSLLVMTGVTGLGELASAAPGLRPTYVSCGLSGLFEPHPAATSGADGWKVRGWSATVTAGRLVVTGEGGPDDWWRAVAAASWDHLDRFGTPPDTTGLMPPDSPADR